MLISNDSQYQELLHRLQGEYAYIHPVFVDATRHYMENKISSYHILFEDGSYYCLAIDHPDSSYPKEYNVPECQKFIALHKKPLLDLLGKQNIVDLATLMHMHGEVVPTEDQYYLPAIHQIKNRFRFKNLHYSIPLMVWMEFGEKLLLDMRAFYHRLKDAESEHAFQFVNNLTIPLLQKIESAGMMTDSGKIVYTDYNIYTATGRPSNASGGINFAALNKADGTRKQFVSRYGTDGILVQFDYEAFHLRLAAKLFDYTLPDTPIHTYLARQYYGTQEITPEQYEESKARTFAMMYGHSVQDGDVDFFKKMKGFSEELWEKYRQEGFVLSGTGRRVVVPDPSASKVFNYLMQLTETEESLTRINKLVAHLTPEMRSNVILYTYDAILLDCHLENVEMVSELAHSFLTEGGLPIREYRGNNYDELYLKI